MKNRLTIGTIIKLYKLDKHFMIVGHCSNLNIKRIKQFDYLVCGYPEGIIGLKKTILIKESEIEKIYYNGYNMELNKSEGEQYESR